MIKNDTYIEDIVDDYPELIIPLKNYGIVCIACGESVWGTLEEQAKDNNIENLDQIIKEMNDIIVGSSTK